MAGITDNETNIVLCRKLQCLGHMVRRGDIHCVTDKVSQSAWLGNGMVWIACSICEERGHERRGGLVAGNCQCTIQLNLISNLLLLRQKPSLLQGVTFLCIVGGNMAGNSEGLSGHETSIDRLVEGIPGRNRGPTVIAREATARWPLGSFNCRGNCSKAEDSQLECVQRHG
jgi:hypothetical protein